MAQYDLILTQNVHATGIEYDEKVVNIPKGGLLSADSLQAPVVLPPGADGYVLARDDAAASGLKWVSLGTSSVVVNNQGDNRVVTATASNNVLNAEANLTFDGSLLYIGEFSSSFELYGGVRIDQAHIYVRKWDSPYSMYINYEGYNGETTQYRELFIGNGKGGIVARVGGNPTDGDKYFLCHGSARFDAGVEIASGLLYQRGGKQCDPTYTTTDKSVLASDYLIIAKSTSTINIYLQSSPLNGQMHYIKRAGSGAVIVNGSGKNILNKGGSATTHGIPGSSGVLYVYSSSLGQWATFGDY